MNGREDAPTGFGRLLSRVPVAPAAALGTTLVFVLIATRYINEPGLFPDELYQVLPALSFVESGLDSDVVPATGPDVSIGGHQLALMTSLYSGQVKTVAFIPVAALFDVTAASVRYFAVAVAALALLATYAFGRRLFRSEAIALVALVLLALDPGFIFYMRADQGQTVFMMLAKAVAIWQLLRWWDTGSTWSLVLGTFTLGVGLYDKFIFIWVIWGLAVATALVAGRAVWRRLNLRTVLIGAAAFLAGCLPLIAYELRSDFGTLSGYSEVAETSGTSGGVHFDERVEPSGAFPSQFAQRVRVVGDLLDGSSVSRLIDSPFPNHFEIVPILVALAALAICIQLAVRRPPSRELRAGAFVLLAAVAILISAAATGPGFHGHHVILTYPFPHLALALVLVQAARRLARVVPPPRRRAAFAASVAVLTAIPLAFSAITTAGMLDRLSEASGRGAWSDEIYDLEAYLMRQHSDKPLATVDWGLGYLLVGLSQGQLYVNDLSFDLEDTSTRESAELLSKQVRDQRTLYVLRSPRTTTSIRARRRFFSTMAELGHRPTLVRKLDDPKHGPQFEVYSVERRGSVSVAPGRRGSEGRQGPRAEAASRAG